MQGSVPLGFCVNKVIPCLTVGAWLRVMAHCFALQLWLYRPSGDPATRRGKAAEHLKTGERHHVSRFNWKHDYLRLAPLVWTTAPGGQEEVVQDLWARLQTFRLPKAWRFTSRLAKSRTLTTKTVALVLNINYLFCKLLAFGESWQIVIRIFHLYFLKKIHINGCFPCRINTCWKNRSPWTLHKTWIYVIDDGSSVQGHQRLVVCADTGAIPD